MADLENQSNENNNSNNTSVDTTQNESLFNKPPQFTKEYFHELREENKKFRLQAQENATKADEAERKAQEELAKRARESLDKMEKLQKDYEQKIRSDEQRFITSELKTAALEAGLKNTKYLQLIDKSSLTLSDDGEVVGLEKAINDVKTEFPDLFKVASSANEDADAPLAGVHTGEKPTYENKAQFEAAKRKFLAANKK